MINEEDLIMGNLLYSIPLKCVVKIVNVNKYNEFDLYWYGAYDKVFKRYNYRDYPLFRLLTDKDKLELL